MLVDVQLQLLGKFSGIYGCLHSYRPFGQHGQYRIVYIIVNQYNPPCGSPYELRHEGVRIIYLPVEEDAFFGDVISFVYDFQYFFNIEICLPLLEFKFIYSSVQSLFIGNHIPHCDKSPHNLDVNLYGLS